MGYDVHLKEMAKFLSLICPVLQCNLPESLECLRHKRNVGTCYWLLVLTISRLQESIGSLSHVLQAGKAD